MKQENSTNRLQTTVPKPGSDEAVLLELIRRRGNRWVLEQAVGREGLSWAITHVANELELDAEAALGANSPYSSRPYALECAKLWRTLLGLGVRGNLLHNLRSTNAIESLNDKIATYTRRVKRWQGGKMMLRWVGAAVLEARKGFRGVRGLKDMSTLVDALERHEKSLHADHEAA